MLMLEDPAAVAQAKEMADLKGYSILACGIGSLTQALGGDRDDAEKRVKEGFLALLTQGPNADEAIKAGRAAAGR